MIDSLGYLISTHAAYKRPLARLLGSMQKIDPDRILVVSGGHERRALAVEHGIVHIQVPHNSFDFTALIEFVDRQWTVADHLFLLHDTMELGPESERLIRQADPTRDVTTVWGGLCNLGLYRAEYLHSCRESILALRDCTKETAVASEGFLWRDLPETRRGMYGGDCQVAGTAIVYGGAVRLVERYSGVDITKYKANWGQSWPNPVLTP